MDIGGEPMSEPFARRVSWNRGNKIACLAAIVFFWGLPFEVVLWIALAGGYRWLAFGAAVALAAVGVGLWRWAAGQAGRLLAEVTTEGLRFRDEDPLVPWSDIAAVNFTVTGGGTYSPTYDVVVLRLRNGTTMEHRLTDEVRSDDIRRAALRLAPPDRPPVGRARR